MAGFALAQIAPRAQLAQINIGRLVAPVEDPAVAEFIGALAEVNALAEAADGFVWRLADDSGAGATDFRVAPDPQFIVNLTSWRDVESLAAFVYRTAHGSYMARRRNWFEPHRNSYLALWWTVPGHRPSIDEGLARLWMLDRYGPSEKAFTFKARFPPPPD